MPPPTNISPATALDVGALPSTIVQDVSGLSGPNYEVWYKYTAQPGDIMIGVWAQTPIVSNYYPDMLVWSGTPSSLTAVVPSIQIEAFDQPTQVPVTPGQTYYFQVDSDGVVPDSLLTFSVVQSPALSASTADVLILDADVGFPAAVIDLGGTLRRFAAFPNAEWGDQLPSGIYAINAKPTITDVALYHPDGSGIATVPGVLANSALYQQIRASAPSTFFFGNGSAGSAAVISTSNDAGVPGPTTWTLPVDSEQLRGMAPNRAQTILYYTALVGGSTAVHRYDLIGNAPLSDLAASLGVGYSAIVDLLVLDDGGIVVGYQKASAPKIICYEPTGSPRWSVTLTDATLHQMRLSLSTPTTFLIRTYTAFDAGQVFYTLSTADGSILTTSAEVPIFVAGVYNGTSDTAPRFGSSDTCPFLLFPQAPPPPPPVLGTGCADDLPLAASSGGQGCSGDVPTSPLTDLMEAA